MKTFEVYCNSTLKGSVNARNAIDALALAIELYGSVTTIHQAEDNKPLIEPIDSKPKEYFASLCSSYFEENGLNGVQWSILSKKDLYTIYLWIYGGGVK